MRGYELDEAEPDLLLRVRVFSDESEVEQDVGEVLISH